MIDYRFAKAEDCPFLRAIWHEAFPSDTEEDIDGFLARVELSRECLVATADGKPISMVFMLPAVLKWEASRLPLQYIYAASTLKAHRGQGVFGELLNQALSIARKQGCAASFLRPAEPSLCDYYARFGYRPFFYSDTVCGEARPQELAIRQISVDEYTGVRNSHLPTVAVEWESRFVAYTAGNAVALGEQSCALCEPRGEVLFVRELLCEETDIRRHCEALAAWFGCERYECRVSAASGEVFGMILPFTDIKIETAHKPFMGLALD